MRIDDEHRLFMLVVAAVQHRQSDTTVAFLVGGIGILALVGVLLRQ